MPHIDAEKQQIRKYIRQLKRAMPEEERLAKSQRILMQVEAMPEFRAAETIMMYWSMDDEVHTHDFVECWAQKKTIILPCVNGDSLLLRRFAGRQNLCVGASFSIPEPVGEIYTNLHEIAFIMVPGVAFDRENNRMGRGKAYYDKLLAGTKAFKAGVCFDFQLLDSVPTDQYDIKMDAVVAG